MSIIDVGCPVVLMPYSTAQGNTYILKDNPANASGKLTSVEVYPATNITDIKIALFYSTGTNTFKTRSWVDLGSMAENSKTVCAINLDVIAGDYIGVYCTIGNVSQDTTGGSGLWYLTGDYINTLGATFSGGTGTSKMSIYATGEAKDDNSLFFGMNF